MNGMNFEEWQALMRAQRNGGTSSEIHNHEAVISNKNPNSESGNAAADELRAKQRYHNEQSKGMATDRKEEVAPSRDGVLFANLLTTNSMVATYRGKVVINEGQEDPRCCTLTQDALDKKIAEGALWGSLGNLTGPYVRQLRNEDGTSVSEEDRIYVSEVPADADLFISAGEGYYIQS